MKLTSKIRAVAVVIACCAVCLSLGSCKGAAGERAEKEAKKWYEAYKDANKKYKITHPYTWEECWMCGGDGWCYIYDVNGNVMPEYYGVSNKYMCPECNGYGYIRKQLSF